MRSQIPPPPFLRPGAARLELLGAPHYVGTDGNAVALGPQVVLLSLVALGGATTRTEVVRLFYPQANASEGRRNLRQMLHRARRARKRW